MHRVALVAGLILGCSDDGTGPSCGTGTATAVSVCDNVFVPATSPISPGASITWTWRGANPHNVTFEDAFTNSTTKTTGTHAQQFSAAGTFRYRCTVHSPDFSTGMVGSVTVQ
jgi:plastocyanin